MPPRNKILVIRYPVDEKDPLSVEEDLEIAELGKRIKEEYAYKGYEIIVTQDTSIKEVEFELLKARKPKRKVLYKAFIPAEKDEKGNTIEGTGCISSDFIFPGEFLHWGITYEQQNTGSTGMYTEAIIELPDGTVISKSISYIKFVKE